MSEYLEAVKLRSSPVHAEGDLSIRIGGPTRWSRQLCNPSLPYSFIDNTTTDL